MALTKKQKKQKRITPTTERNATHNTVACYYDQQNYSCGRDRTPQYQPFHMNTPTVLPASSHTLRGNREESSQSRRKKKKKTFVPPAKRGIEPVRLCATGKREGRTYLDVCECGEETDEQSG